MDFSIAEHLVMIAEFDLKPDAREDFLQYTVANLGLSRNATGNIAFDIRGGSSEAT